ncbi:hypothetical protein ABI_09520 [Asticcacaulis biprosthecium C19]|uniref:Uncharacterized protein n=1 Tax=Asticcacaulis biprosthecium C19 TaxID=715226 RepID=F4QGR3_9CAUL|nr:hypothetical protein [Asticcacaulis biprosthecium]EGF92515.1 hypothetical protein ABI_09520 [Asticcacaulis biprosthecium C19]
MPTPLSSVSDVLKAAIERAEQPDVSSWPDGIDAKDTAAAIAEAASGEIFEGEAAPGSWASQAVDRATEAVSKLDLERVAESLNEQAKESTDGGVLSNAFGRLHEVAEKVQDMAVAAQARMEVDDGVIDAAAEDDVYEAAPVEVETAETDDDPYDSDNV